MVRLAPLMLLLAALVLVSVPFELPAPSVFRAEMPRYAFEAAAPRLRAWTLRAATVRVDRLDTASASLAVVPAFLPALVNVPIPAHLDDALEFPHALAWSALPKSLDLLSTAECLDRNPRCREGNPLQPSAEHRIALGAALSVTAALIFYEVENRPAFRQNGVGRTKWWAKVPRWTYAAAHVAVAVSNFRNAFR